MADQQHSASVQMGDPGERVQSPAHTLLVARENLRIEKRHDGINHEQSRLCLLQCVLQPLPVRGQTQRSGTIVGVELLHEYAVEISAKSLQTWTDRVLAVVLTIENECIGGSRTGAAVGKRQSSAEPGAEVERDQRLSQIGVAVENGKLAQSKPARPKP